MEIRASNSNYVLKLKYIYMEIRSSIWNYGLKVYHIHGNSQEYLELCPKSEPYIEERDLVRDDFVIQLDVCRRSHIYINKKYFFILYCIIT